MNEQELRQLIKLSVGMSRLPRNLDIFYYFKYTYDNTISSPFISTKILQHRLGVSSHKYKKYMDAWVEEFIGNPVKGKLCRHIKWSKSFTDIMKITKSVTIPISFIKKIAYKTKTITDEQMEMLRRIYNNNTISSPLTDFYHSTQSSSFRLYHPLQTLKRQEKAQAFKGMYDIDIDSCFSSIAYHELGIKDERLNPLLKDDFRRWVMKEENVDYKEAKQIISRLFTGQHTQYNKRPWYNDLFNTINKAVWNEIKRLKCAYPEIQWSHHQYFTYMEQRLINKIIPEVNLVLRMHDGFISGSMPNLDTINHLSYPHTFSAKKI